MPPCSNFRRPRCYLFRFATKTSSADQKSDFPKALPHLRKLSVTFAMLLITARNFSGWTADKTNISVAMSTQLGGMTSLSDCVVRSHWKALHFDSQYEALSCREKQELRGYLYASWQKLRGSLYTNGKRHSVDHLAALSHVWATPRVETGQ